MKNKTSLSAMLNKMLYSKKVTIPLSLVLAFIIWISVIIKQNPIRDQVFTGVPITIPIENTVLSEMGIGIVSDISTQTFTVTISGPNYVVSSVKSEDFILSASVADVTAAGTYTLDVVGNTNSSKTGYTFASITPATIDVTFDYIDTKEYTLEPRISGVKAAQGLVAGTPVINDAQNSTITIKGPRTIMDTISVVAAEVTTTRTLDKTDSFDADIVLYNEEQKVIYRFGADGLIYNADGKTVETTPLTLNFTTVKVSQPILKRVSLKVVPVFTNLPAGISVESVKYTIDHPTVYAMGTPEVIEKLSQISLSAIDFRSVSTTSNSFEVSPVLPDGVKLADNIEFFKVDITTSGYAEKVFNISDFKLTGLGSGLTVKSTAKLRNVKICGPSAEIKKLTEADIYGVVDITDKVAGEYTVDVVIKSDKSDKFWQVGTYSTNVEIANK